MKVRHKGSLGSDKIELQMTPMIDIVFQLLVFFILTFKVVAQEGDFSIRMPAKGAPTEQLETPESTTLRIRLESDENGDLARLKLDNEILPPHQKTNSRFTSLHSKIRQRIDDAGGPDSAKMMEVEFECDYNLKYTSVIDAITAVSGYKQGSGNNAKTVKLIEKIKFAPPKNKPPG